MENENKERKKIRDFIKVKDTAKKIRNVIKVNKPVGIVVTVLACLAVVGVSFTVYSKYYKTGFNKGMATASGFYFNSNYMAAVEELKGITPEKMHEIDQSVLNSIIVSANRTAWEGGDTPWPFLVHVRNYDNQLLYNDKDLDVKYTVHFMLLQKPVAAKYTVSFGSGDAREVKDLEWDEEGGYGKVVTFNTGELLGGTLNADIYTVEVLTQNVEGETYEPSDVLMVAYPTAPEYLRDTKVIAGIVRANMQERPFSIEGSRFLVTDEEKYQDPYTEDSWKEDVILKESAYVYQLYTSGNFSGNGSATRKTIYVKWREDMYIINDYDIYYQEAKKNGRVKTGQSEGGHNWTVMEIDILPYASLKFTFFRAKGFEEVIKNKDLDKKEFENSVQIWYEGIDETKPDTGGDPTP